MSLLKRNITTILLLEPIELSYGILDYYGLEEAYVADIDREELKDCIICLFNLSKMQKLQKYLEEEIYKKNTFLEDYDYNGYIAVAFKFPQKYIEDYNLIKGGKYSETSNEFKKLYGKKIKMLDKNNGKVYEQNSSSYKIINRDKYLKEDMEKFLDVEFSKNQEIWKGFQIEKETLDINKYEIPNIKSFTEVEKQL